MARDDWSSFMLLKTGFGQVFDVGHGWSYAGLCAVAEAINSGKERDWQIVEQHASKKPAAEMPS